MARPVLDAREPTEVAVIVARVGKASHHKTCVGKCQSGVEMAFERTTGAMRHDDERQVASGDCPVSGNRLAV